MDKVLISNLMMMTGWQANASINHDHCSIWFLHKCLYNGGIIYPYMALNQTHNIQTMYPCTVQIMLLYSNYKVQHTSLVGPRCNLGSMLTAASVNMAACLRIVLLTWVLFVTNAKECDWDSHRNTSEFTIYPDDTFLQGISVSIFPSEIVGLVQGDHITVYVNYSGLVGSRVDLRITASDQDIIRVGVPNVFSLSPENAAGNVSVHGLFLGRTQLQFHFAAPPGTSLAPGVSLGGESDSPGQWWPARIGHPFEVSVVRAERILDHIFIGVATLMVIFANMAMGCAIDLNECKKLIKKPIAPAIGFACQFIIMPLVSSVLFQNYICMFPDSNDGWANVSLKSGRQYRRWANLHCFLACFCLKIEGFKWVSAVSLPSMKTKNMLLLWSTNSYHLLRYDRHSISACTIPPYSTVDWHYLQHELYSVSREHHASNISRTK